MGTEQLLFILGMLLLIGMVIIIVLLLQHRQPIDDNHSRMMRNLLAELRQEVHQTGGQNRLEMQERLDQIFRQIANHQHLTSKHLVEQHHSSNTLGQDIAAQLTNINNTNTQILGFAQQMRSLEKILQNPKQRGILGEYFLENLLSNVLSPKQYKMQYTFKSGIIVDAAIFFRNQIIPIDAKFSLDKYNKLIQSDNPAYQAQLEKAFRNDLKKRIDETSKYILPQENTTDFAFMFIPAEGIFHSLLSYQVASNISDAKQNGIPQGQDLIEYAFSKRVIVVSPTSFYAYLETVLQGLKALKIEESVQVVIQKVADLGKHLNEYETYLDKVGKHLQTAMNMQQQASKAFKKIDTDVLQITNAMQQHTDRDLIEANGLDKKSVGLFDEEQED